MKITKLFTSILVMSLLLMLFAGCATDQTDSSGGVSSVFSEVSVPISSSEPSGESQMVSDVVSEVASNETFSEPPEQEAVSYVPESTDKPSYEQTQSVKVEETPQSDASEHKPSPRLLNSFAPEYGEPAIYIESFDKLQAEFPEVSYPIDKVFDAEWFAKKYENEGSFVAEKKKDTAYFSNRICLVMAPQYTTKEDQWSIDDFAFLGADWVKEEFSDNWFSHRVDETHRDFYIELDGTELKILTIAFDYVDSDDVFKIARELYKYDCVYSVYFGTIMA